MRKIGIFFLLSLCLLPSLKAIETVFPNRVTIGEEVLEKVGEGTFKWTLFTVYDGAFYLSPANKPKDALDAVPKQLVLTYHLGIEAEKFVESGTALLKKNLSPAELESIQTELRMINQAYLSVEEGDTYILRYLPSIGTSLILNGTSLVTIPGEAFARFYYRIWLGEESVKSSFKRSLLGE